MKRPYISGPLAGAADMSREEKESRFTRAELALRSIGYDPVNPLSVTGCQTQDCNGNAVYPNGSYKHSWSCWLRFDLIEMLKSADGIAVLPRWEESEGSKLERHVALQLGWEVIDLTNDPLVLGLPHELDRVRGGKRARR